MTKHEARSRGLGLAAKLTGIAGIALVVGAMAESAAQAQERNDERTREATGESALRGQGMFVGNCGCAPCWGPPAPPARGVAS